MRLATLDDISGASSWDVATFFALHGSVHNTLNIVYYSAGTYSIQLLRFVSCESVTWVEGR